MKQTVSAGAKLHAAMASEKPLQIVGTVNAYCALLAKRAGFKAIYLSGAGVANASLGLPDLGITTLNDVGEDVRRIVGICDLPLLVDIDTGFGGELNICRAIKEISAAGAAGVHIEDQVFSKRCGHRPNTVLVDKKEMVGKIKAAVNARLDPNFVIMARTDAIASEGLSKAIDRAVSYVEAGADMIFAEAACELEQYRAFVQEIKVPILANITEFGKTPMFTVDELSSAGVSLILYPLSAFRAMSQAALRVYNALRQEGTQAQVLSIMQTRQELYEVLNYHHWENMLEQLFVSEGKDSD